MKITTKAGAPRIPQDMALEIARKVCAARSVTLVMPGEAYRLIVVYVLAGVYALASLLLGHPVGWTLDQIRDGLSITLPGAGPVLDLVRLIPVVGPYLARLLEGERQTQVVLSPDATRDGGQLLTTLVHELLHAGQIARGHLPWCLLILLDRESRAGAEGPAYGQTLLALVYLCGYTPDEARAECIASLTGYDLDEAARELCVDEIAVGYRTAVAGGMTSGALEDVIRELWNRNVDHLPIVSAGASP